MAHILQVWFEVSQHTNRVHFNGAMDGSRPLGMSLPLELLETPGLPALLAELLSALGIGYAECTDEEGMISLITLMSGEAGCCWELPAYLCGTVFAGMGYWNRSLQTERPLCQIQLICPM